MTSKNPFATPEAAPDAAPEASGLAACPACGLAAARRLTYTWWGGWIGARLLTHVECTSCGERYNGKTGGSNTRAIIAYHSVLMGLGIAVALVIAFG